MLALLMSMLLLMCGVDAMAGVADAPDIVDGDAVAYGGLADVDAGVADTITDDGVCVVIDIVMDVVGIVACWFLQCVWMLLLALPMLMLLLLCFAIVVMAGGC